MRADGIGAQAAQLTIKKVADAYTTLRVNLRNGNYGKPGSTRRTKVESKPIRFRHDAAQPYDQRNLSFALDARTVSLWAVEGRLKDVPYVGAPKALKLLGACKRGEADLLHRDGLWLLLVTVEVEEAPLNESPAGFLGVDLGIVNISTTSDGTVMAGRRLNRHRARQRALRAKLQAKRAGVPVLYVDPAYSRTCAECGHVDKRNRVSQAWFACRSCGVVAHADRNGSRVIAARAVLVWDAGRQSSAPAA